MVKGLVCGMDVNEGTALQADFQGETYYFCSDVCRKMFQREPERYILSGGEKDGSEGNASGDDYSML